MSTYSTLSKSTVLDFSVKQPADLLPILIDWLWDSPAALIPSNNQIFQIRAIILNRPDVAQCVLLIRECDEFLSV